MLKGKNNRKRKEVPLEEKIWQNLINQIMNDIRGKIAILKSMISAQVNEYVCAGLYTFILEEFGKLILLQRSPKKNSKITIKYAGEFTNHEIKFSTALNYLQQYGYEEAYVLNNHGSFSPKSFSWKSFTIGQLVNFDTRLALFYTDLELDKNSGKIVISRPPFVDIEFLKKAVTTFEKAIDKYASYL